MGVTHSENCEQYRQVSYVHARGWKSRFERDDHFRPWTPDVAKPGISAYRRSLVVIINNDKHYTDSAGVLVGTLKVWTDPFTDSHRNTWADVASTTCALYSYGNMQQQRWFPRCTRAMNKTKCQPVVILMVYWVRGWREKGKGRVLLEQHRPRCSLYDVVLRAGHILLTLILWLGTITDSRGKGIGLSLVCVAFLMGTSFGWMTLSCCWRIWKAMLWMHWMPARVEIGSSSWKPGCSLLPSNSWLLFHLFLEDYFCMFFFKNKTTKVVKYLLLIGKNHVLLNLLFQLVP